MTQQLFEQWFRIADADKDGAVGGAEAVSFFTRSGLPQTALGQIWELSSGGGPKLNQMQFSSAMRLVALAQARGGQLPLDQARATIAGVGPNLPPPTLQGLEAGGAAAPPAAAAVAAAAAARPTGAAPVPGAPQYGGPVAGSPYAGSQLTAGAAAPAYGAGMIRPAAVGAPGTVVAPTTGPAPVPAVAPAAGGGYPPLPVSELQRYQAGFVQLDADRDGFVTGAECFGFFTQSGLDKAMLRDIWSLVAGNDSRLSAHQFVAFLYVMECLKRGMPLPKYLPPGLAGFPPVAQPQAAAPAPGPALPTLAAAAAAPAPPATWSLQSQFGTSSNITAVLAAPPVTSLPAPPAPLAMPVRLELPTGERLAPPMQHQSRVPAVSATLLAGVSAMDRTKLQEEQQVCEAKEKAVQTAEERVAETRARQAQLTTALQELVMFRNRTEVALLTSQDQARRLEEEVEATRKRYDMGYAAAQSASEKSAAVHAHIMELMSHKAEMEEKMRRLEAEVAAAERMGPADVARLEGELADFNSKCATLEVARNAKMAQVDGLRRQQDAARAQLADLQDADRDAGAEVDACQASLESMEAELKGARALGIVATLPSLLSRAATVYRGLYGIAHRTGTTVPFDALPATLEGLHVWADEVAAGVVDWADDEVDARGYVVVNALPGADAPRPIRKPAPPAEAAKPAVAPGTGPAAAAAAPVPRPALAAASKMLPEDFAAPAAAASLAVDGFDDPPPFGDAPAFGFSAPPPAAAAAPSAPVDFGFDDAPAFGASSPPPASLPPSTSFALEPTAANAFEAAAPSADLEDPSSAGQFATGFSFGREGESSIDTPSAVSAPPATAAPAPPAFAAFDENAVTSSSRAAFPPPPAYAGSAAAGNTGGSAAATAATTPAEATRGAAASQHSLFGDDAFGAPSGFGDEPVVPVPAAASDIAAAAAADSPASSPEGAAPPGGLPPTDSGAFEANPFAWGAPPAVAAFASAAAGAAATTTEAPVAAAAGGFAAAAASSELFGDSAFGVDEPSAAVAVVAAPASSAAAASPQQATPVAAVGFGEENPFGDNDNPFGTPAFR